MNIIELAHRICWRYKHSKDPHHSSTYTFNESTLQQFAKTIRAEALEEARTGEWINSKGDVLKLGSSWRLK